jgi:hypothetical protein
MKYQWLVYLLVFVLIIGFSFAPTEVTGIIIFMQFFIGATQMFGSIVRYVYKLSKLGLHDKTIFTYWMMVLIYFSLVLYIYYSYINHIPSFLFELKRQVTFFVFLSALLIAVWYTFNITFLKTKKDGNNETHL